MCNAYFLFATQAQQWVVSDGKTSGNAPAGYLYNKFSTFASMDFSPPPVTVAAAIAREETWPSTLEAVGTLRARRGVNLAAEASGEIVEVSVFIFDYLTHLLATLA